MRGPMKRVPSLLVLLLPIATACTLGHGNSSGIDHTLQFSYTSGECLFGCSLAEPLMVGTEEHLSIQGPLPAVLVVSTDPSIIAVSNPSLDCCTKDASGTTCSSTTESTCPSGSSPHLTVDVAALGPGTARVRVLDTTGGKEIDAVDIDAEAPASLSVTCSPSTVAVGDATGISWTVHDTQGAPLRATRGLVLTTSDVNVVALESGLFGSPTDSIPADANLFGSAVLGVSAGDAVITATVANLSATTTVHVKP
jgi:hypothetical protein